MSALPVAIAATRNAVRAALAGTPDGSLVLVACSGGGDSLALAAATAFVAARAGRSAGLITVDHGLQDGSAQRAADVAAWAESAGLDPVATVTVDATPHGDGPEAAARDARYRALADQASVRGAAAVLLGHTRDDQAETVLLALARGAGPRGLSGMPAAREIGGVRFIRPFLELSRAETRAACDELGLKPWSDPHNADPRFARSRVRAALPLLVEALGDDVVANLARTAGLIAADNAALDAQADREWAACAEEGGLSVPKLAELAPAIRTRVLRRFALQVGATPAALSHRHIEALDALVIDWHGQGAVALPSGVEVLRQGKRLLTVRGVL